ncbi:hypothetical protein [Photobacterium kishitanii]|uniref:Uncharacterized protein n=1 Tax=Photobacterium kishitanii TaxID=318456 RepID=A0A2T3KML8_9GAMM|nr:hypothetical protein [Photobacterium kishitanii]PSV01031.1 hypothetical protein C9J27_03105 [Photobacterium kishitanii]
MNLNMIVNKIILWFKKYAVYLLITFSVLFGMQSFGNAGRSPTFERMLMQNSTKEKLDTLKSFGVESILCKTDHNVKKEPTLDCALFTSRHKYLSSIRSDGIGYNDSKNIHIRDVWFKVLIGNGITFKFFGDTPLVIVKVKKDRGEPLPVTTTYHLLNKALDALYIPASPKLDNGATDKAMEKSHDEALATFQLVD